MYVIRSLSFHRYEEMIQGNMFPAFFFYFFKRDTAYYYNFHVTRLVCSHNFQPGRVIFKKKEKKEQKNRNKLSGSNTKHNIQTEKQNKTTTTTARLVF